MRRQLFSWKIWLSVLLPWLLAFSACSPRAERSQGEPLKSISGTLDPQPQSPSSTVGQLQRYLGQNSFLSVSQQQGVWQEAEAESPAGDQGPANAKRSIEEADLFKLGMPGSGLVYLLNSYRGLQVVEFSPGASSPVLRGRAPATGNEPLEMYFDREHLQILVLERGWDGQSGYGAMDRVLLYDVKDASRPKLVQTVELSGSIADSRIVGNILYVASSRWTYFADGSNPVGEGQVNSYKILESGLQLVSSKDLSLPVSSLKNMNIVESSELGQTRYYLISVLAENRFSWADRRSTIEVLDISDPNGNIQDLLKASIAGEVQERSATTIKDGTLIAVSNKWGERPDGEQILRVSVESFKLPGPEASQAAIDPTEAEFRRLWFEREMQKRPAAEDAASYAAKLKSDPQFGLQGVFVRQTSGGLAKLLPDQAITVGDDSGQHADLQDVRFYGDKLYVFWVPANQVDPLDVFDIKEPSSQLRYLGRTLFEGWIERAIPLNYQGRDFILGLGWITPPLAVEARQKPQVVLFGAEGNGYKAIAQLTLSDEELWSYFNDEDKQILVNSREDGKGTIMFPASFAQEGVGRSGGKVLSYDLGATAPENYLAEGALLAADASWIRRIFENPELNKLHTLTDRSLGTYDFPQATLSAADQIIEASSILELARDIVAYTEYQLGTKTVGVQMIRKDAVAGGRPRTSIRLVDRLHADAELPDTSLPRDIPGRYEGHLKAKDGSLLLLTSLDLPPTGEGSAWAQELRLTRLTWKADDGLSINGLAQSLVWTQSGSYLRSKIEIGAVGSLYTLQELGNGDILLARDRQLRFFTSQGRLSFKSVADPLACVPENSLNLRYHQWEGQDFVSYSLPISSDEPAYAGLRFEQHFIAPLRDDVVICEGSINIPGRPLSLREGRLITEEERFLGFSALGSDESAAPPSPSLTDALRNMTSGLFRSDKLWPETARALYSLELRDAKATLRDIYGLDALRSSLLEETNGVFMLEQPQSWGERYLVRLSVGEDHRFMKKSLLVPMPNLPSDDIRLLKVLPDASGQPYFLMQAQRQGYILREHTEAGLLKAMPLHLFHGEGASSSPLYFPIFNWFESEVGLNERLHYDAGERRLTLAQGLWGILQLEIVTEEDPL